LELGLNGCQDFVLNGDKVGPIVTCRNKIGQWMLAHHCRLSVAQPLVQERFRRRNRIGAPGESGEEGGWI
jgi:hypothetical protein